MADDLLTVAEVAALLRVHTATVYRRIHSGDLAVVDIGTTHPRWRIARTEYARYLAGLLRTGHEERRD